MNNRSEQREIGLRIKALRKEWKISQARLAQRVRRDQTTISDLERGKIALTPLMSLAICGFFAVREEWLLTGTGAKYEDRKQLLQAPDDNFSHGNPMLECCLTQSIPEANRDLDANECLIPSAPAKFPALEDFPNHSLHKLVWSQINK